MKDAEVLILDKASSALDAKAETEAFKQIIKLTAGKIAAIVSHRYSTVLIANRIMVLKDGKVLENGTQGESMAKKNCIMNSLPSRRGVYVIIVRGLD